MTLRPRARRALVTMLVAAVASALFAAPARAASPKQVDDVVAKAVKYLYQVQKKETGDWEGGIL